MVRYTFALRGPPKDESSDIALEEKNVDIFNEEQLSEQFLCEINPYGQVPVLASPVLEKTIPDSLQITHHIARLYPSLIPDSHEEQITSLLSDLHSLNYFSLSFSGKEHVAHGFKTAVQQRLNGSINDRYRAALKFKLDVIERQKIAGLDPGTVGEMNQRARGLMEQFESLLAQTTPQEEGDLSHHATWLFGLPRPTALDAHLIVFIDRMLEVGKEDMIPEGLKCYAQKAMGQGEWKSLGLNQF